MLHTARTRRRAPGPARRTGSDPLCLRLERRRSERRPAAGLVMATFRDELGEIRLVPLELLDASDEGLGARSRVAIPAGTAVLTAGAAGGTGAAGAALAVSCRRDGAAYRVGLRLPYRAAA